MSNLDFPISSSNWWYFGKLSCHTTHSALSFVHSAVRVWCYSYENDPMNWSYFRISVRNWLLHSRLVNSKICFVCFRDGDGENISGNNPINRKPNGNHLFKFSIQHYFELQTDAGHAVVRIKPTQSNFSWSVVLQETFWVFDIPGLSKLDSLELMDKI